jgi:hypothetical protein
VEKKAAMKRIGIILAIAVFVLFFASAAEANENVIENKSDIKAKDTLSEKADSVSSPILGFILNDSSTTLCAEEDNINMPLYYKNVTAYRIIATHPTLLTEMIDKGKNCTNCPKYVNFTTRAQKIYDDKNVIIETVIETPWWRYWHGMNVSIKGDVPKCNVTYFRIYKLIDKTVGDYPQVFVLYEDGNARIIPQPPIGMEKVTFGSSVILGATEKQERHFVDIDLVDIDPQNLSMDILYKDKTKSHVELQVNRSVNTVEVSNITFDTSNHPFARFRSMWVKDGNADIDHIRTQDEVVPIMGNRTRLNGTWWQFFRKVPSIHNTYCPDIKIEVFTQQLHTKHE